MHPFFAINRLSAYLDGDLPRRERLEVERVLSRHPELEAELLNVQNAVRLISQVGPARAPRRLVPEVLQALEERQQSPFRGPDRVRNMLLGLGVTLAIATGLAVWMNSGDSADAPAVDAAADAAIDDFLDGSTDPDALAELAADPPIAPDEATASEEAPASEEDSGGAPGFGDAGLLANDPNPGSDELEPVEGTAPAGRMEISESRRLPTPPQNAAGQIEPFIPDWDKDPVHAESGSSSLLQVAVYRVYANTPDILRSLHDLAQANGTLLTDSMGKPIQIRSLSGGDDFASAHLTLPAANMEVFLGQLARLGLAVEVSPPDAEAERQSLLLEVMYKP